MSKTEAGSERPPRACRVELPPDPLSSDKERRAHLKEQGWRQEKKWRYGEQEWWYEPDLSPLWDHYAYSLECAYEQARANELHANGQPKGQDEH